MAFCDFINFCSYEDFILTEIRTTQLNLAPGMIDLAVGQPSPALLPLGLLRQAADLRLGQKDASLLAYGAEAGDGYFRIALSDFLSEHYQFRVDAENLFVTAGASQGLDLICTLFTRPGDTIFVEEPSYFLALRIFADHGLKIVGLPMDADGLVVEVLEEKLQERVPAFLYTIPTFHNPASVTLTASRRQRLVELSRRHNLLIVADEVYHLLAYADAPPSPLAQSAETGLILSLGSFSKIMAPGLRLGWIQATPHLLERLTTCGLLDSGGGLNPFTSALVGKAIEKGLQHQQLATLKSVYARRKVVLRNALRAHLSTAVRFTEPDGGFFIWLEFPEELDTAQMLAEARRRRVGYLPGQRFSSRNGLKNYARLSFSYFDAAQLEEGVRRLAKVIREFTNVE